MANWATVGYRIEGNSEDLQQLNELCKAFLKRERPVMEEGASEEWEGNIILALGIDKGTSYLRGFIQDCELEDGVYASMPVKPGEQRISDIFLKVTTKI